MHIEIWLPLQMKYMVYIVNKSWWLPSVATSHRIKGEGTCQCESTKRVRSCLMKSLNENIVRSPKRKPIEVQLLLPSVACEISNFELDTVANNRKLSATLITCKCTVFQSFQTSRFAVEECYIWINTNGGQMKKHLCQKQNNTESEGKKGREEAQKGRSQITQRSEPQKNFQLL